MTLLETRHPEPLPTPAAPADPPRTGFTGPDVQLAIVLAAMGFYVASVGIVIVVLAEDLGLPVESLSWIGSIFGVALILGALVGPAVLRRGPSQVLAVSTVTVALGFVLIALAPTLPVVAVGAALQSLGATGVVLVIPTLLTGPTADARLTRVNAVSSAVGVLAPLLIGVLIGFGINGRLALLATVPPLLLTAVVALRNGRAASAVSIPPAPRASASATPESAPSATSANPATTATSANPATSAAAATPAAPARVVVGRPGFGTMLRRWLPITLAVSAEFSFVVWSVARLVDAGLDTGRAATVGAAFPIGMALGRVVGPWVMRRVPAVPLGTSVAAVGTVLVVASSSWVVIAAGLVLAGLGVATLYPVTLVNLMRTPGLSQSMGSSLGALASGVAITVMPAFLALLAGVVDLRLAYLVVLPLLGATAVLYGRPAR